MESTARELVSRIIDDGSGVYTNDAGNGCAGPGYLDTDDLQTMLDSDDIDEYEIITSETWDGRDTVDGVIASTLSAHRHDPNDETDWILAERVQWTDGCQNNPYRHYLLLWEV